MRFAFWLVSLLLIGCEGCPYMGRLDASVRARMLEAQRLAQDGDLMWRKIATATETLEHFVHDTRHRQDLNTSRDIFWEVYDLHRRAKGEELVFVLGLAGYRTCLGLHKSLSGDSTHSEVLFDAVRDALKGHTDSSKGAYTVQLLIQAAAVAPYLHLGGESEISGHSAGYQFHQSLTRLKSSALNIVQAIVDSVTLLVELLNEHVRKIDQSMMMLFLEACIRLGPFGLITFWCVQTLLFTPSGQTMQCPLGFEGAVAKARRAKLKKKEN
ncbi:hypothetical protein CYMTET_6768 [Cymbomonas tetramitiformis]|uniref:Uncharacterized protein n=1 Tax=Cymbomonas tetramitiformis TaxID=36881 RepID=A0AAE0GWX2_9CHLO|nr:hypothetical protein CYMTET_6768 [Cymbomonas tetramitiformis]